MVNGSTVLAEVRNITKVFKTARGTLRACDDVSLIVRKGYSVGLVGESGSGKSTLARILLRLVRPTNGNVFIKGIDVTNVKERTMMSIRRYIQFVAQDARGALLPHFTIGENILEPMRIHKTFKSLADGKSRSLELMKMVGLPIDLYHAFPHELSGGQQQRVCIARALALDPELIVLDEATASLDVSVQAQIVSLLLNLKRDLNITYLFISHNLAVVRLLCDYIYVMYKGNIVERGESDEIFNNPKHPYTVSLLSSLPVLTDSGVSELANDISSSLERESLLDSSEGCIYQKLCPFANEQCKLTKPKEREISDKHVVACHYVS